MAVDPVAAPTVPGRAATWERGDEAAWRVLASYSGPLWDDTPDAGRAVLLDRTLCAGTGATWQVAGLVRNESAGPVAIAVDATLHDAAGAVLGTYTTDVPVTPVRAGEPAPFLLRADVPRTQVAEVVWQVRASPATGERGVLVLAQWWERPAGEPRPIDSYLRVEGPEGPFPYALFGSVTNRGAAVPATDVVAAWADAAGKVCWVATAPLSSPTAASAPLADSPETRAVGDVLPDAAPMPERADRADAVDAPADADRAAATTVLEATTSTTTTSTHLPPAAALLAGAQADFLLVVEEDLGAGTGVLLWAVPR